MAKWFSDTSDLSEIFIVKKNRKRDHEAEIGHISIEPIFNLDKKLPVGLFETICFEQKKAEHLASLVTKFKKE